MAMMLKHKPTGDVYIYTELLARRDDMETFESAPPPPPTTPQPAKLTAAVKPVEKATGDKS
jgi:hypothetical protein